MLRALHFVLLALLGLFVFASCNSTGQLILDDDDAGDDDDAADDDDDSVADDDDDDSVADDDDDDDSISSHKWMGEYEGVLGIFRQNWEGEYETACWSDVFTFEVDDSGQMSGLGECFWEFGPDGGKDDDWARVDYSVQAQVEDDASFFGTVTHNSQLLEDVVSEAYGTLDDYDDKTGWEGWWFSWELEVDVGWGPSRIYYGFAYSE